MSLLLFIIYNILNSSFKFIVNFVIVVAMQAEVSPDAGQGV